MNEKHKLQPAINKKVTTDQQKTLKKSHVTFLSLHLNPRFGHVTIVSGYSILSAVN